MCIAPTINKHQPKPCESDTRRTQCPIELSTTKVNIAFVGSKWSWHCMLFIVTATDYLLLRRNIEIATALCLCSIFAEELTKWDGS